MELGLRGTLATLVLATACTGGGSRTINNTPTQVPPKTVAELETELAATLKKIDANGSIDGFRLPDSATELAKVPADPKNPLTAAKVSLGKVLFHDTALLDNPQLNNYAKMSSCAACHVAEYGMAAGIRQALGDGGAGHGDKRHQNPDYPQQIVDQQPVATPIVVNMAYSELALWDGSLGATGANADAAVKAHWNDNNGSKLNSLGYQGLETQAMVGQDTHRLGFTYIKSNATYISMFKAAFPDKANSTDLFSKETLGQAIAAYLRSITTSQAPFQRFVRGERTSDTNTVLLASQLRGAALFFGKAACFNCHSGPALNHSSTTHQIGFEAMGYGDLIGPDVLNSDSSNPKHLGRYAFTRNPSDAYKFKVPQLYNLKKMRFFGHGSSFGSVSDVIHYYNLGVPQNPNAVGHTSSFLRPLSLSEDEMSDLADFVVNGLYDANFDRFVPTSVPSGQCFPEADPESKIQLGCH